MGDAQADPGRGPPLAYEEEPLGPLVPDLSLE